MPIISNMVLRSSTLSPPNHINGAEIMLDNVIVKRKRNGKSKSCIEVHETHVSANEGMSKRRNTFVV